MYTFSNNTIQRNIPWRSKRSNFLSIDLLMCYVFNPSINVQITKPQGVLHNNIVNVHEHHTRDKYNVNAHGIPILAGNIFTWSICWVGRSRNGSSRWRGIRSS